MHIRTLEVGERCIRGCLGEMERGYGANQRPFKGKRKKKGPN
jgi:hypothetical protein